MRFLEFLDPIAPKLLLLVFGFIGAVLANDGAMVAFAAQPSVWTSRFSQNSLSRLASKARIDTWRSAFYPILA